MWVGVGSGVRVRVWVREPQCRGDTLSDIPCDMLEIFFVTS